MDAECGQRLAASTATWKLVGNPDMIARVDVGTLPAWLLGPLGKLLGIPANGYALNIDQWDGYNADREELVNHLRANNVRDVVFLTGDIHTSWASELVTQSTLASPTAVELVVPSVTSDNLNDFLAIPAGIVGPAAAALVRAAPAAPPPRLAGSPATPWTPAKPGSAKFDSCSIKARGLLLAAAPPPGSGRSGAAPCAGPCRRPRPCCRTYVTRMAQIAANPAAYPADR